MSAFGADHFRVSGVRLLHIALADHRARSLRSPHAARHHRRLDPVGRHRIEIGVHKLTNIWRANNKVYPLAAGWDLIKVVYS